MASHRGAMVADAPCNLTKYYAPLWLIDTGLYAITVSESIFVYISHSGADFLAPELAGPWCLHAGPIQI